MPNRSQPALLAVTALVCAAACRRNIDPTDASHRTSAEGSPCPAGAVIADGETNNNQISVTEGRAGYWYTFVDKDGSSITPKSGEAGGVFEMAPGGPEGSKFAAHMHGTTGNAEPTYAGMGLSFVDPKGPYDASKYGGIAFFAKRGQGSTSKVRLKVPDKNTDPDGGVCSECFNDFGIDLKLTEQWQLYTVPFSAMSQMKGWGSPKKSEIEKDGIYGVQFQVADKGQTYDVWVDNIQFTGCSG